MMAVPETGAGLGAAMVAASNRFTAALEGADADELAWRSTGGGWTVGDIAEHVTLANGGILSVLEHRLEAMAGPPDILDDDLPYLFYRGDEPPHIGAPSGTWTDAAAAGAEVRRSADAIAAWAAATVDDLRSIGSVHPAFGRLDGAQWAGFAIAHTLRHHAQLLGFRARYTSR